MNTLWCFWYQPSTLINETVKWVFGYERYLSCLDYVNYKISLFKFCMSLHNLPIETGRKSGILLNDRVCTFCKDNEIGDAKHYFVNFLRKICFNTKHVWRKLIQDKQLSYFVTRWWSIHFFISTERYRTDTITGKFLCFENFANA